MNHTLLIRDVYKRFGDTWVLRGVRAAVPRGKITAFVGPNGAGKTTLFHVIAGALQPDEGRVLYEGQDITDIPAHVIAQMGVGRQFQDVRVFNSLTARDNVVAGMTSRDYQWAWRAWHRPGVTNIAMREMAAEAEHWLEYVGLVDTGERLAGELSYGQQKLLSLARLFARKSPCLLLDEPTAGVSHAMVDRIVELIRKRVSTGELTVAAFVEHNMSAVEYLADWIHFLNEGRVAFSGRGDHVLGDKAVREMYMGI